MKRLKLYISVILIVGLTNTNLEAQLTKLLDFDGAATGGYPNGDLVSDGTFLYGITSRGGTSDSGTVFKIKPNGTGYSKLLDFNNINGGIPEGSLMYDGTFLYGTTEQGGTNGQGTVFKIKPDGSSFTKLLDFDGANGARPDGSLISVGSFLYGLTSSGGTNNFGTLFRIKPDGTSDTLLFDFNNTDGASPYGSLIAHGNFLYGMTSSGGASGRGIIFKIGLDGTGYEIVFDFSITNTNFPLATLITDGSFFYGMAHGNGANGNVFKIMPDGSNYTELMAFNTTNGLAPKGSLLLDGAFLYGTTAFGGTTDRGTLFKIKTDGTNFSTIINFTDNSFGTRPIGTLISVGSIFYGMTNEGGSNNSGALFKFQECPSDSIALISAVGSDTQEVCINNPITSITYAVSDSVFSATGLPSGVTGVYTGNIFTISGTPTIDGTFNYTITAQGSCGSFANLNGRIIVDPAFISNVSLTSAFGTDNQTLCINTPITTITYSVTGSHSAVVGLPPGVFGKYTGDIFTISGTPTVAGVYFFNIGAFDCMMSSNSQVLITVGPLALTSGIGTDTQKVCKNTPIAPVTYYISDTNAVITGLPPGVNGSYNNSNTLTISGTPTIEGVFNYTITTTGTCPLLMNAFGTIIVNSTLISLLSDSQTVCINTPIVPISYYIESGKPPTVKQLPNGVSSVFTSSDSILTISGSPIVTGTYRYKIANKTICGTQETTTGTIKINSIPIATINGGTYNILNSTLPKVVFRGQVGTPPYTFSYTINDGSTQTVISNDSVTFKIPVIIGNSYVYKLFQVEDANGCIETKNDSISYKFNTVSINEFNKNNIIEVFPNPFNDQFKIICNAFLSVKINDITGKEIYNGTVKSGESFIELGAISSGLYFMTLSNNKGSITKKVIKN